MKNSITFLLVLFSLNFYSQWTQQVSGTTEALNDVFCVTENLVFVVGDNGTILKTTDGGENWVQKTSGSNLNLIKVQFANANIGCAVSASGTLLKTIDGGENWSLISNSVIANVSDLSYFNENIFYCISNGLLVKTTNGGNSFEAINTIQTLNNMQFINENTGFAISSANFLKTINGGISWTNVLSNHPFATFFSINENVSLVYSPIDGVYKTIDGGITFSNTLMYENINIAAHSKNENIIWELNKLSLLCECPYPYCAVKRDLTTNSEIQDDKYCGFGDGPNPFSVNFTSMNSIFFANDITGYIVGFLNTTGPFPANPRGVIYKNSSGTNLETNTNEFKETIKIYPNPASEQINISLTEKSNEPFTIEITDFLGKKVYSQIHQAIEVLNIDTKMFSKGMYLLTMSSQNKRETHKVIVN
jgi:photosystem II stability/assembly factor-like uncharacterized protein